MDITSVLEGGGLPERPPLYWYSNYRKNAMRKGKWKLHISDVDNTNEMPMLIDMELDPEESYNVGNLYPEVMKEMLGRNPFGKEEAVTQGSETARKLSEQLRLYLDYDHIYTEKVTSRYALLTGERPEPAFLITKPFQHSSVKTAIAQALFFNQATVPA